ncbi:MULTISPECIES: phage tail protein [Paenibacillus]|uniref:phage tail protein n=1 Tax=Paenibacillus TaxID=44249 RepID=UPI0022B90F76|nr:tail fiber protein [Paenibacillus caseinilyticus]MCZ8523999.1 tail fiber protein [Paenibacillus caseinilyticus]
MEPFLGEIRIFAGNFAPRGWAFCNGQLMAIAQNTALFSLLGVMYGGNGRTTFALPNLMGRVPIGVGQGPGLNNRTQGEAGGNDTVTLLNSQIPSHTHTAAAHSSSTQSSPEGAVWSKTGGRQGPAAYVAAAPDTPMSPQAVGIAGGNQPHNNRQPFLAVNYIIALEGIYPPRS